MTLPLVLAVPKGRILEEFLPILEKANIVPEDAFFDKKCRQLRFKTNQETLDIVRVRSFDVATFVKFGAAALGIAGSDVLDEFDSSDIYSPVNLNIGHCRLSIACPNGINEDISQLSHIRVATKYPASTKAYFHAQGIQAECIKLNGAMELAPKLELCNYIVDLVSTGNTLTANGLKEIKTISEVSSYLIANRGALKTQQDIINPLIADIKAAIGS